jgi:hypothetical protein
LLIAGTGGVAIAPLLALGGFLGGAAIGDSIYTNALEKKGSREDNESLAKALANGDIINNGKRLDSTLTDEELEEKYGFTPE